MHDDSKKNRSTNWNFFVFPLITVIFLSLAIAAACEAKDRALPVLKIAYNRVIDDLPFFVGVEEGFFDREGVHVELTTLTGTTNTLAAVMKDDLQGGIIGATQLFFAAKEQLPIKVVAWLGRSHKGTVCGLHCRKSENIRSVADLRGKRIVLGSDVSSQALISEALARNGMKTKDVRIISGIGLDDPMKYEAVLKSGRVDVITA